MKTNLKKVFAISIISLTLCGCNEGENATILKVGFDKCSGSSAPTPQVGLAFTSKNKQSLNATFDVYVGARKGFSVDWKNNLWGCNPGYGKFAINREITAFLKRCRDAFQNRNIAVAESEVFDFYHILLV